MTDFVFREDGYLKSIDAKVACITAETGVVLDRLNVSVTTLRD